MKPSACLGGVALAVAMVLATGCSSGGSEAATAVRRAPSAGPTVSVLPQRFVLPGLGRERSVRVYLPPSYASAPQRRYPVIYMHDGQNLFDDATSYVGEWGVDETLDGLARSHGFEAIVVGIDHGGPHRMTELNPWSNERFGPGEGEAYAEFIVEVLKPAIDRDYRTLPDAANTAVIGSSMGGLMSDYLIRRHPEVFGKAGLFSPAYWVAPEVWSHARQARLAPGARVYLSMGGAEGRDMLAGARRMNELLSMTAPPHAAWTYRVVPDAPHNEGAWRQEVPLALAWLFQLPAIAPPVPPRP